MINFFKNILFWLYLRYHSIMMIISQALYNTEMDILKSDPNDLQERDKKTTRMLHRNPLLEKFYAGNRDEKYTKDFYEILKKADMFMKKATPNKMAIAADKYHTNYGMKDEYGRRYEHYGFFDDKHKHAGKTLGEVLEQEMKDRRTNDDDYELLYIFDNAPIEVGLSKIMDVVQPTGKKISDREVLTLVKTEDDKLTEVLGDVVEYDELEVQDMANKSKQFTFPIKAQRDDDTTVVNKIEQLTEYLHIKHIGFEHRQLEFFIPLKFKTSEIVEGSDIFNEIINFKSIFIKNDYGELIGFGINKLTKRIIHNDTHEVWKFEGIEMKDMGTW